MIPEVFITLKKIRTYIPKQMLILSSGRYNSMFAILHDNDSGEVINRFFSDLLEYRHLFSVHYHLIS